MGASPWENRAPWTEDPAKALKSIQQGEVERWGDPSDQIRVELKNMKEALDTTEVDDPYGLAEHYAAEVKRLERLMSEQIPTDFEGRLNVLRALHENNGEGIGNILDVTGVSTTGDIFVTKILDPDELLQAFGTEYPGDDWMSQARDGFFDSIGRGESVCFPIYSVGGKTPTEWCFFGYSVD